MNIDGNTSHAPMTQTKNLFEKLKNMKDVIEIGGHIMNGTDGLSNLIESIL
ncbi:MAG: hypothetical protein IPN86_08130 [Saprospiraceae bacterium]|nr:hypothetical protein [Saprospiraceae bacterium]